MSRVPKQSNTRPQQVSLVNRLRQEVTRPILEAAEAFFKQAKETVGHKLQEISTMVMIAIPKPPEKAFGLNVEHRTNKNIQLRCCQDHKHLKKLLIESGSYCFNFSLGLSGAVICLKRLAAFDDDGKGYQHQLRGSGTVP